MYLIGPNVELNLCPIVQDSDERLSRHCIVTSMRNVFFYVCTACIDVDPS
jgi:hypothetical protein